MVYCKLFITACGNMRFFRLLLLAVQKNIGGVKQQPNKTDFVKSCIYDYRIVDFQKQNRIF